MELYVLDQSLNVLGIIDDYEALIWERVYSNVGTFKLEIIPTPETFQLLAEGNILVKNDITHESMYIDNLGLSRDEEGKEILVVEGFSILAYLSRRVIGRDQNVTGNVESVIRNYVNLNCITTTTNRIIPNLQLGVNRSLGTMIDYSCSYKEVLGEISDLSSIHELGLNLYIDLSTKKMIFEVYQGLDRTHEQSINSRALFSEDFENLNTFNYNHSSRDYKNMCIVAGAGEGKARKVLNIGEEQTGLNRYELFVDARDISDKTTIGDTEVTITPDNYNKLLTTRGNSKLAECTEVQAFECEVLNTEGLLYRQDYNLGDKVTVFSNKWGIVLTTRIVGITETYSSEGLTLDIKFGNNIPTLLQKIKRRLT